MREYDKISGTELYAFWKSFSVALLILALSIFLSKVLPHYFSPIVGLVSSAFLYTMLYNAKLRNQNACMIVPYTLFHCLIVYSFISILINVLDIWDIIHIPKEMSFFNHPYVITLLLDPVCFFGTLIILARKGRLYICIDCKLKKGTTLERGKMGEILSSESDLQLKNLMWIFGIMTIVVWFYYLFRYYQHAEINNRDWYIFIWINIFLFIADEIYFMSRYYNLYLDLKERGELNSEAEAEDDYVRTYLRFYVICGNHVFLNTKVADESANGFVIDTPFTLHRNLKGISAAGILTMAHRLTGIENGELRFFYSKRKPDSRSVNIERYFYFLNGTIEDYPDMKVTGEWIDFKMLNFIHNTNPERYAKLMLIDFSRITTIVLTQKLFDENGNRRSKILSYQPVYDLEEVREKHYDFQDDKWIRIAMTSANSKKFRISGLFRRSERKKNRKGCRQNR
ncbi:MAG: hypothetical protein NC204_03950 [Candidatus Amulumruptor caecigallinarius]|nr:hypothetical protein [Candidatus Amulumruptor caecigallinarius]